MTEVRIPQPSSVAAPEAEQPEVEQVGGRVLERSGYALVASTGVTAVLGLAYWALAARTYAPAEVGKSAAVLSALALIGNLSHLGLKNGLIRFVAPAGARAGRLIRAAYLSAAATAFSIALVFLLARGLLVPELDLLAGWGGGLFFAVACAVWVVFILQDSALIGLRKATWVPVENALYAGLKLLALAVFAVMLPRWGIVASWTVPLIVLVIPVNWAIFSRVLSGRRTSTDERLATADLIRFSAGDYLGSVLWLTTVDIMPIVVLAVAGAATGAYYHLSWTIAYTIYLIASGVGAALVSESAHDPARTVEFARRSLRQSLSMVVPAVAVVVLGAPLLLSVFGADYSAEASTGLRLFALSALPHTVNSLYVHLCRARREIASVVRVYAVLCLAILALSVVLVDRVGVTGAGLAWLLAQSVVALVLLGTRLTEIWAGMVPMPVIRALGAPGRARRRMATHREVQALAGPLSARVVEVTGCPGPVTLHPVGVVSDVLVVKARPTGGPPVLVKIPTSAGATAGRRRGINVERALAADESLDAWRDRLPVLLDAGAIGDRPYAIETWVGIPGSELLDAGVDPARFAARATAALDPVVAATARWVTVDERLAGRWIDAPVQVIAEAMPERAAAVERVGRSVRERLVGRTMVAGRGHGDFTPGNVLWSTERSEVTGIIDWEASTDEVPPQIDRVLLLLALRQHRDDAEMGAVVADLMADHGSLEPWEDAVLARGLGPEEPGGDAETWALLAWLRHIAANLSKGEGYGANAVWVARNVDPVTAALSTGHGAPQPKASPLADSADKVGVWAGRHRRSLVSLAMAAVALALWAVGIQGVERADMGDTGLMSALGAPALAGVALLGIGLAWSLVARPFHRLAAAIQIGALVLMVHATAPALYAQVRYEWAWKHIGVVDYIQRTGSVDRGIAELDVYHSWPGFFAGNALVIDLFGLHDGRGLARWAPLVFAVLTVAAVAMITRAFLPSTRLRATAVTVFVLGNWVGQEYFSPQAIAYLLYLVVIALVLRHRDKPMPLPLVALCAGAAVVIVTSHQLTPPMLALALGGLAVLRVRAAGTLAAVAAVATLGWAFWFAHHYVGGNLRDTLSSFGQPLGNAGDTLNDTSVLSDGQAMVALASRGVTALILVLAALGLVSRWRSGHRDLELVWLAVAPGAMLVANDFGGEILYRALLFSLPFLSILAAHGLGALAGSPRLVGLRGGLALGMAVAFLLPGTLLVQFGKDAYYTFTDDEVAASAWIAEDARPGSVVVEATRNYPGRFRNYERLSHVPIDDEPTSTHRRIGLDPAGALRPWLADDRYTDAYVLLTGSMEAEAAGLGTLPTGLVGRIEAELHKSPRFTAVFDGDEAVVFQLTADVGTPS